MEQIEKKLEKRPPMQAWLLLCTLAVGWAFAFPVLGGLLRAAEPRDLTPAYAIFWGLYLLAYYLCLWKRAAGRWEAWYLFGTVMLLFAHSALYRAPVLTLLNFAVIPLVLMLHAVLGALDFPQDKAWPFVRAYLVGWFVYPFSAVGKWFGAIAALFRGGKGEDGAHAARRNALLGALCGLPVLVLVCALLIQADLAMGAVLQGFLDALPDISFGKLLLTLLLAMLFYSFLYNLAWGRKDACQEGQAERREPAGLPAQSFLAAGGMLLLAYAVFAAFQFAYLTGFLGLPAGLTYSEYAVSGFSQLLWVAAINLGVFSLGLCRARPHRLLKPLLWGLLAATAVVLLSAFVRLGLYIQAYALTWKRVLSLWLMLYLAATVALCGLRLAGKGVKRGLLRLCALALVGWYVVLNLVNVEGLIAQSVLSRAEARGALSDADVNYLRYELTADARQAILKSGYRDQVFYGVSPQGLP